MITYNKISYMKRILFFLALVVLMQSCVDGNGVVVEVHNPTTRVRMNEMVELDYSDLLSRLQLVDTNTVVVLDHSGEQVPYQITHDNKLIFMPAPIEAGMGGQDRVVEGAPQSSDGRMDVLHFALMALPCRLQASVRLDMMCG